MLTTQSASYQDTYDAVLRTLRHARPATRWDLKNCLFTFRYGAGYDHAAVEDARRAYELEIGGI